MNEEVGVADNGTEVVDCVDVVVISGLMVVSLIVFGVADDDSKVNVVDELVNGMADSGIDGEIVVVVCVFKFKVKFVDISAASDGLGIVVVDDIYSEVVPVDSGNTFIGSVEAVEGNVKFPIVEFDSSFAGSNCGLKVVVVVLLSISVISSALKEEVLEDLDEL